MNSYKAYKKGYLEVSDGHKLYYEMCGNPNGKPALFIHGGPGGGFTPKYKRFFDPNVWNILLFDQRGAGRSKPFASIENNDTWKLVEDTKKFLDFCKVDKAFLVGASWGSTLSLVFAVSYPEMVSAILISGLYLGSKKSTDYGVGDGAKEHFPEVWERMASHVPKESRDKILKYYYQQATSDDREKSDLYKYEWVRYELSLTKLNNDPSKLDSLLREHSFKSLSIIELHYFSNDCFLPEDYIVNNVNKISNIPITLIQGRYDLVCRPEDAYEFHKKLKNSKLHFTVAGHSTSDKENKKKIKDAIKELESV